MKTDSTKIIADLLYALAAIVDTWESGNLFSDRENEIGNARKAIQEATKFLYSESEVCNENTM